MNSEYWIDLRIIVAVMSLRLITKYLFLLMKIATRVVGINEKKYNFDRPRLNID